ncbi:hypothetical protein [Euzebya tangerina]|uniref:hypothetical protein n=1 Tax=Euzebya tangerina TaxID=591198 RepID=UPI0013C32C8C|nr:hypothetical protein [Euzebya tangerina]
MATPVEAVRSYLTALRDPESLKDETAIAEKSAELESSEDVIKRLELQEELRDLQAPSLEAAEDEFVMHAKAWADEAGISGEAFIAEGVPAAVLKRAGFTSVRGGRKSRSSSKRSGTRVTTEEVIAAIPTAAFTVKQLQNISGASAAVVRKAIGIEVDAGRVAELGTDPDHSGPGRAPTLYKKS